MKLATVLVLAVVVLTTSSCSRRNNRVQAVPLPVPATPAAPGRPASAPAPAPAARPAAAKTLPAPQPPAPVPEPLVTAEQRSSWSEEIEVTLRQAEQNAAALQGRSLPAARQRDLGRVQSFIRQARAAEKAHDYVTARSYAQRAEVLSRDLLNR
jgi:hypothetical protein